MTAEGKVTGRRYTVGLDLGQKKDYTAIAVVERAGLAGGTWRVPKRDLVMGLQVLLETGALRIAAGLNEGETFVKELTNIRVRVSGSGHDSYAAWREGTHDDLVLAAALACWRAKWPRVGHVGRLGVGLNRTRSP